MSASRKEQIKELFEEASELQQQRDQFLRDRCPPELRPDVERLLQHDEAPKGDFLQGRDDPKQINQYHIERRIGEGGMGTVYLAQQLRPIERQVALKLINLGMNTREVMARFDSERQALAMMNHPNIAVVHDAGATDKGHPYFVMEYIPGKPITAYCDEHRLGGYDGIYAGEAGGRVSGKVERLQRFVGWEAGGLESPFRSPALPVEEFHLTELEQEAEMIDVVLGAAGRHLLALTVHGGQLQGLEMMLEQDRALGFGLVHAAPPTSRPR